MIVTYKWLNDFVDLSNYTPQQIADIFTSIGYEIDEMRNLSRGMEKVVIGKIQKLTRHPNADKLSVCKVNDGTKDYEIVCGAPNVAAGQTIPLATIGAVLPGNFVIKPSKIRGVSSQGMICSEEELGLAESSDGIMVLPENTPLGKKLEDVLGSQDTILEIEITTNRGDCLSHWGVAREIAAKLKKIPNVPQIKTAKYTKKTIQIVYFL